MRAKHLFVYVIEFINVLLAVPLFLAAFNPCATSLGIWIYLPFLLLNLIPMFVLFSDCGCSYLCTPLQIFGIVMSSATAVFLAINSIWMLVSCIFKEECNTESMLVQVFPVGTSVECSLAIVFGLTGTFILQLLANIAFLYVIYSPAIVAFFA